MERNGQKKQICKNKKGFPQLKLNYIKNKISHYTQEKQSTQIIYF